MKEKSCESSFACEAIYRWKIKFTARKLFRKIFEKAFKHKI